MAAVSSIIIGTAALASAGMQAYGAHQSKKQSKAAARQARSEAAEAVVLKQEEIETTIGAQEAAFASSGVELNADTPLAVLNQTRQQGLREIQTIQRHGVQAANNILAQGRQAYLGGMMSAASTVAGAAGTISGNIATRELTAAQNFRAG